MAHTWWGCRSPWGWPTRGGAVIRGQRSPGDGLHVVGLLSGVRGPLGMAYTWLRGQRPPGDGLSQTFPPVREKIPPPLEDPGYN